LDLGRKESISFNRGCRVSSPTISEEDISANLFSGVVPLLFGGMYASFVCGTGAAIPRISYPKEVLYASVSFQKHPY